MIHSSVFPFGSILTSMLLQSVAEETCHGASTCLSAENVSGLFPVELLQTGLSLKPGKSSQSRLPILMPLARSLTSEDPEAAAEWMIKYHGATRVQTNLTSGCVQAVAVQMHGDIVSDEPLGKYTMYFVKDTHKWAGSLPRNFWQNLSDKVYHTTVTNGNYHDWNGWLDFHDGIDSVRDLTAIRQDNIPLQPHEVMLPNNDDTDAHIYRANMPNTTNTIELGGKDNEFNDGDIEYLQNQQQANYSCRNWSSRAETPLRFWKKATYAVARNKLASAFDMAEKLLGFVPIPSPYPGPEVVNCQSALWGALTDSADEPFFDLHLVASAPVFTNFGAERFHEYQAKHRNLESGCFDHYLYNSLILWTDSLDPFVQRLQEHGVPFLALKLAEDLFSVTFSFPGNEAITFDIRSSQPSSVEHIPFDPCTATECDAKSKL